MSTHSLDKVLQCNNCKDNVHIPHNKVGGFWHMSGWTDKNGAMHSGGMCVPCFNMLKEAT